MVLPQPVRIYHLQFELPRSMDAVCHIKQLLQDVVRALPVAHQLQKTVSSSSESCTTTSYPAPENYLEASWSRRLLAT